MMVRQLCVSLFLLAFLDKVSLAPLQGATACRNGLLHSALAGTHGCGDSFGFLEGAKPGNPALRLTGGFDSSGANARPFLGSTSASRRDQDVAASRSARELQRNPPLQHRYLMTPPHDHLSYYGFMFNVRAIRRNLVITCIKMGSTFEDSYSYRIFASTEPYAMISQRKEYWEEVGEGKMQLPEDAGTYSPVPLHQKIEVQAGQTRGIYIHCDNAEGVAYRYGVAAEADVTDRDEDLEVLSEEGRAVGGAQDESSCAMGITAYCITTVTLIVISYVRLRVQKRGGSGRTAKGNRSKNESDLI